MTWRAQARARRDLDLLEVQLAGALGLGGHLLVALQPGLGLGLAALGVGADPLQLVLEPLGQLGVLLALDLQPLGLLLQVRRVVALVGVEPAAVDLGDPLGHVVEEVPVVGDGKHGAGVLREVLLEPLHRLGVQVVGRLVEQQQVGLAAAAACTAPPGDAHRRRGWRRRRPPAGSAARPWPARAGVQVPRVGVVDLPPGACPSPPAARRSRRRARPSPPRSRCSGRSWP